uniref:Uncharacterized protein n=1 Tax=viral metagenome TaxID=1070528 RepID=A0A6M3LFL6_9ZZZZ
MNTDAKLNSVEAQELRQGQDLYELTKIPGFKILEQKLKDMAFHSWVDPREIEGDNPKKIWEWRELNAFHAANNARELLEWIQSMISRSEYLDKKKSGEIVVDKMRIE